MDKKISVMIGGSMTFAPQMKEAKQKLEGMGFEVNVPLDTDHVIKAPEKNTMSNF